MRDLESDHRDSDGVISFKAAAELIPFAEFRGRTGRLLSSSDSQEHFSNSGRLVRGPRLGRLHNEPGH